MSQASLPLDLHTSIALDAPRNVSAGRPATVSEASLWLFGLTSATLVFASLLLLGLLAQGAVLDASVGGFLTAMAVVAAALGAVGTAYVLTAARQAGYADADATPTWAPPSDASTGLRVAPAVVAEPVRSEAAHVTDERARRSRQARAIAAVEAGRRTPRAAATPAPPPVARPVALGGMSPATVPVPRPPAAAPRPVVIAQRVLPRSSAVHARLRFSPPPVHPQARAALFQVGAASVRLPFERRGR